MSSSTRPDAGSVGPAPSEVRWTAWSGEADGQALPADRYADGGELGRGGMGVVEVATDVWLDREVARKRPRADLDPALRERLVREARITARLDHPGIVPVFDYGVDARGPFYTMPVLGGTTLEEALREDRPLPALIRVLEAVARALAFAHARGVVHRDLKPANVRVGAFGEVRVLDWGVALDPASPDTHPVGTPGFQAPEQAAGLPVGPPADVFALGRVLDAVLAGRDPALSAVVERATRPDPSARYPDAGAFADELARWLDGRRVQAHDYPRTELLQRFVLAWRGPLALGGVLAALGISVLGGWATTNGWERDRAQAAERASEQARQAADASLAAALPQTAGAWLRAASRPAAEVLAARALTLTDSPEARGVLMAWSDLPRPVGTPGPPRPCADPRPAGEGVLCVASEGLRWIGPDGTGWKVTPASGRPVRTARSDGRTVALVDMSGALEIWRDGELLRAHKPREATLEWAADGLFLRENQRVGRLTPDGDLQWSPPLCERLEAAWTDGTSIAGACSENALVEATFDAIVRRTPLGHPPSAVVVDPAGRITVGTFDGLLLTSGTGYQPERSGVGAVTDLRPWAGWLVVSGEELTPHVWDPASGTSLARWPRAGRLHAQRSLAIDDGQAVTRWSPPELPASRLTRGGGGGVASLALSPDGQAVLVGNAGGDLTIWEPTTGRVDLLAPGCGNVAKAAVLFADLALATRLGCDADAQVDWRTGEPAARFPSQQARLLERHGEAVVRVGYSPGLQVVPPDGPARRVDGWFSAVAPAERLWVLTRAGGVGVVDGQDFHERFVVPDASDLARADGGILVLAGDRVGYHDADTGALRWSWQGARPLTRVEAAGDLAVVGDLDGGLFVIGQGRLLASARGHTRRISEIRVHRRTAYTASWDGTVRRWDLGAATAPIDTLIAGIDGWGLSVEEIVRQVTP